MCSVILPISKYVYNCYGIINSVITNVIRSAAEYLILGYVSITVLYF